MLIPSLQQPIKYWAERSNKEISIRDSLGATRYLLMSSVEEEGQWDTFLYITTDSNKTTRRIFTVIDNELVEDFIVNTANYVGAFARLEDYGHGDSVNTYMRTEEEVLLVDNSSFIRMRTLPTFSNPDVDSKGLFQVQTSKWG